MSIFHRFYSGAKVTISSLPSLSSLDTAIMQMFVEPLLSTFLYLLLSGMIGMHLSGSGQSDQTLLQATLAAVLGSCSLATSLVVSEALAWDKFEGTTRFVLLASRSAWPVWCGRVCALIGVNLVSNFVTLFVTLVLVDAKSLVIINWGELIVLLIVTIIASTGFGLTIAALGMLLSDIYTVPNFLSALLPIIGGVIAPVTVFPQIVQRIIGIIPLTHITQAARAFSDHCAAWQTESTVALIVGVIWFIVGLLVWQVSVYLQRKRGTLTNLGI
ncbi:ABC transporter [Alloscardovia theropitheci]|uniref:Transport permease protein n=1 Tax=Alloscardovia theropitheci TaxID=2496842 RepID=A0A4R0QNY7_9BIFI|nr:ABC transporter permease [Alloscardovia theropitheci]TCD53904.1 ABC transporter [Alloscardovia theropitheci]